MRLSKCLWTHGVSFVNITSQSIFCFINLLACDNFSLFVHCWAARYSCCFYYGWGYGNKNACPFSKRFKKFRYWTLALFSISTFFSIRFTRIRHSICFDYFRYTNKIIITFKHLCVWRHQHFHRLRSHYCGHHYNLQHDVYEYPVYCLSLVTNLYPHIALDLDNADDDNNNHHGRIT